MNHKKSNEENKSLAAEAFGFYGGRVEAKGEHVFGHGRNKRIWSADVGFRIL